ncbi:MAG: FadR family transcriptional regulator [Alphaproteobacteria bacterium]|nr:FadR family transcriptional regulator [Alphaproteobacteria bacterium]
MSLPLANGSGVTMIVAELRDAIETGAYGHGQRLPAERDLAKHYGASRTTVREALGQLEGEGLVIRKVGSGTFVNWPTTQFAGAIADVTSPLELMEVREAIEPHLARMVVVHASAKDLEQLEKALADLEACAGAQAAFSSADERFHMALAEATGNPLMAWIYGQVNDVRCHDQWTEMKKKVLSAEAIGIYNRQHRALLEAIRKRDAAAAVAVVKEHLEQARCDLMGASPGSAR